MSDTHWLDHLETLKEYATPGAWNYALHNAFPKLLALARAGEQMAVLVVLYLNYHDAMATDESAETQQRCRCQICADAREALKRWKEAQGE